jgi:hypothetical protein
MLFSDIFKINCKARASPKFLLASGKNCCRGMQKRNTAMSKPSSIAAISFAAGLVQLLKKKPPGALL